MRYTTVTLSLRPTHRQKKRLEETQRIVTDLRNRFVTLCNTDLVEHGYFPSVYDLNAMIPEIKKNEPQLKRVHSNTLQNASLKAHEAVLGADKAGPNKDGSVRIAKLKTEEDSMSFEYPSPKHFSIEGDLLYLGVMRKDVGGIPFKPGKKIRGPIKRCIISRKKKTWLAHLIVEIEDEGIEWIEDDPRYEVGIDLGLKQLIMTSYGTCIDNVRFDRALEEELVNLYRRMSKLDKTSAEYRKLVHRVRNKYERINNLRAQYLNHVVKELFEEYNFIAFEDIKVKKLMEVEFRSTRRSQNNAAWGIIIKKAVQDQKSQGAVVVLVDPRGTSQRCSGCGMTVKKDLSVRIHACPYCGLILDRDHNAALNILAAGRAAPAGLPSGTAERERSLSCTSRSHSLLEEANTIRGPLRKAGPRYFTSIGRNTQIRIRRILNPWLYPIGNWRTRWRTGASPGRTSPQERRSPCPS